MAANGPATTEAQAVLKVFLFTDLVGSTDLKSRLGDAAGAEAIARHDEFFRHCLSKHNGQESTHTGDGFFTTFNLPSDAVRCALEFQQGLAELDFPEHLAVRIGIHIGEIVQLLESGAGGEQDKLVGLAVDIASRVMELATGGQTLLTHAAFDSARQQVLEAPGGGALNWMAHGPYRFKGIDEPLEVYEVGIKGLSPLNTPAGSEKAKRIAGPDDEETLGWRPAAGHSIPGRQDWQLERKLGEGGFGEVWLARHPQTHEQRTFKFCFKAERLRMLKRELTLFRLMKEALGERPDIARLYDVHLSEAPYFLEMDYSEGGDLAEWVKRLGGIEMVTQGTRLALVMQVAKALAAAHSVGVIHKDVKPTNVLIEEKKDGKLQARLTDFGIGQLTKREVLLAAGITDEAFSTQGSTVLSELASRTGTQLYMAPELLAGKPPSIQSDVYALGVMLYQLVVGDLTRPLGQGWEREIEDELLREDIGNCVDGDPQRRLANTSELADRLQRLAERKAQREAEKRAQMLAQRVLKRRKAFTVAAIAGLALMVFLTVFAIRENQRAKNEAQLRQEAATEAETAQQVIGFLIDTFNVSDPWTASQLHVGFTGDEPPGETITARRILETSRARLERELDDQPEIKARLIETIGLIYCNLANYQEAERLLQRSLEMRRELWGEEHIEVAQSLHSLGHALYSQGKYSEAEKIHRQALEMRRKLLGDEHLDVAESLAGLGHVLMGNGLYDEAEKVYRDTLTMRRKLLIEESELVASSLHNVGNSLLRQGKAPEAEEMHREALAMYRRLYGDEHLDVAISLNALAVDFFNQEKYIEAEERFREILVIRRKLLDEHPGVAKGLNNLATALMYQDKHAEAGEVLREAVAMQRKLLGDDNYDIALFQFNLSRMQFLQEDWALAVEDFQVCGKIWEKLVNKEPQNLSYRNYWSFNYVYLGRAYAKLEEEQKAREAWTTAVELIEPVTADSDNSSYLDTHAQALLELGRVEEARPMVKKLLDAGWEDADFLALCRKHGLIN